MGGLKRCEMDEERRKNAATKSKGKIQYLPKLLSHYILIFTWFFFSFLELASKCVKGMSKASPSHYLDSGGLVQLPKNNFQLVSCIFGSFSFRNSLKFHSFVKICTKIPKIIFQAKLSYSHQISSFLIFFVKIWTLIFVHFIPDSLF